MYWLYHIKLIFSVRFICFVQISNTASSRSQAKEGMQYLHIKTCMPIEEHAQSILTPYAFNVLQNEIVLSMQYVATEMGNGSYLLQHYKKMDVERFVNWTQDDEQVQCSCKEFEHSGILCRHSIRVLVVKNYFKLPDKYLLLRWQLQNSLGTIDDAHSQGRSEVCAQAFHSLAANLLTESLISQKRLNYVCRELSGLLEHVRTMPVVDEFSLNTTTVNNVNEP